jgi:ribonuclease HI
MTDAVDILIRETRCTGAQAQSAVAALVNIGWTAPAVLSSLKPPAEPEAATSLPTRQMDITPGGHLVAHTDGACSGNPGPGGWAVVFSQDGEIVREYSGYESQTTNNRMELTAIREAIRLAAGDMSLEISTDSKNAIGWLSGGWKRKEQAIAAICAEIDQLRVDRASTPGSQPITFTYVRGHDGDFLNERADTLATSAIRQARQAAG